MTEAPTSSPLAGDRAPTLHEQMLEFLTAEGLDYERHDDERAARIVHQGDTVEWACIAQVWEEPRVFAFYSVSPLRPLPAHLARTAELVHRLNLGMLAGNFEIDLDDGELRLKTMVGFGPNGAWSDELARVVVYTNLAAMNHYLPALLAVITGADASTE